MRAQLPLLVALGAVVATQGAPASACSIFEMILGDDVAVADNYDWDVELGLVMLNKRGVAKQAMVGPGVTPAEWTSRFGSVTFNQYGREVPQTGMNEAGLVVAQAWLEATAYPAAGPLGSVNELQWMQYVLDNFATIDEVVDGVEGLGIVPVYGALHYFVCDSTGACAALEYLDGALTLSSGDALPFRALTNDTYADSLAYAAQFETLGGTEPLPRSDSSLDRFCRAASGATTTTEGALPGAAFDLLDDVAQGPATQWSIVYLPRRGQVHFRTVSARSIRYLDLADVDWDCTSEVSILDMTRDLSGDVTDQLEPYTRAANFDLISQTLGAIVPPGQEAMLEAAADYPEALPCTLAPTEGDADADAGGDADADGDGDGDAAADGGGDADSGAGQERSGCTCSLGGPAARSPWLGSILALFDLSL